MNLSLWFNPKGYAPELASLPVVAAIGAWDLCGGAQGAYTPDVAKAESAGRALAAKGVKEVIIEVEPSAGPLGSYGPNVEDSKAKDNAARLAYDVIGPFCKGFRGVVGFFGYPIQHTSWGYVGDMHKAEGSWGTKFHRWQNRNDLLGAFILPFLGMVNEEIYVRHDSIPAQVASTEMMLAEGDRVARGRKRMPVFWHLQQADLPSNPAAKNPALSIPEMMAQARLLRDRDVILYTSSVHSPESSPGTQYLASL